MPKAPIGEIDKLARVIQEHFKKSVSSISSSEASKQIYKLVSSDFSRIVKDTQIYSAPGQTVQQIIPLDGKIFTYIIAFAFCEDENCDVYCRAVRDPDGFIRSIKVVLEDYNAIETGWIPEEQVMNREPTPKTVYLVVLGF